MRIRSFLARLFANWPAKILSLTAAIVLFLFYRVNTLDERFFSVKLEVRVPADYTVAAPHPQSARITLRGEEDLIYPILENDIVAYVDLTIHESEGVFRAPVKVQKQGTALDVEPLEIRVEPPEITVTLEREIQKSVVVVPRVTGNPARGYELARFTLTPSDVEVKGAASHVEPITEVLTEEIDLSGRSESFDSRVRLIFDDPYVVPIGESVVEFQGSIVEMTLQKTMEAIVTVCVDMPGGIRLRSRLPLGSVVVRGAQGTIERLRSRDLRLIVDCSQIEAAGVVALKVVPEAPSRVTVVSYSPREIVLEFELIEDQLEEDQAE